MSNLIQQFITGRAERQTHLANGEQPVTREDFDRLAGLVTNMSKAVEGLIEDFETVTGKKLETAITNALKDAKVVPNGKRTTFTPPSSARKPLALPADRSFLAPSGD